MLKLNHPVRRGVALSVLVFIATSVAAAENCASLISVPVNYQVSFEADIQPLIDAECSTCHSMGSGSGSLNMRFDVVRANLLGPLPESGRPSGYPGFLRVTPDHPAQSLVFLRINCLNSDNPPITIPPMPPSGNAPIAMQALMYDWIANGAIMAGGNRIFVGTFETIR